jgi:hypothetical protein
LFNCYCAESNNLCSNYGLKEGIKLEKDDKEIMEEDQEMEGEAEEITEDKIHGGHPEKGKPITDSEGNPIKIIVAKENAVVAVAGETVQAEEIKPEIRIKIMIDWAKDSALVGVQRIGDDPIFTLKSGPIEGSLKMLPEMLADAREKWEHKFKYEKYTPPAPEPKKGAVAKNSLLTAGPVPAAAAGKTGPVPAAKAEPKPKPKSSLQNKMW